MAHTVLRAALLAGAAIFVLPAFAQEKAPDIVITPNKQPQSIQQIGSATTIITRDEIDKAGFKSVRDLLDGQPGLTFAESGGPGGLTSFYIRGTDTRHTLVLIDGMRINDPTTTAGEIDLSIVPPQMIDRIEIVRGPQSALYGSDAIGGIINIITKKGQKGPPRWQFRAEGGSYGTYGTRLGVSGATEIMSYNIALGQFHTDGFQRYGYRVPRLAYLNPNGSDPLDRLNGVGRFSWRLNDWLTLETGFEVGRNRVEYDSASGPNPLATNIQRGRLATAYQKAIAENGPFRTTLTTFQSRLSREYAFTGDNAATYVGNRAGAELQQDVNLAKYGLFTLGTRYEYEHSESSSIFSGFGSSSSAQQRTSAGFALYQVTVFEKLHLSAGGRVDHVSTSGTFNTYRLTAAYALTSATRLRASYGTGAKAPSLYQLTSAYSGNLSLKAETSKGFDVGVDQTFLDGDARVGVAYFNNRIENLITADPPRYVYYNVAQAKTSGVEVSADYNIWPTFAKLKGAYTYLNATNETTGLALVRRPKHSARMSAAFWATPELTIEPVIRLVGSRPDAFYNERTYRTDRIWLKSYARFDLIVDYKVNKTISVFARAENLTNVKYEDVYNYGTAGRSVYAGVQMTW